MNRQTQATDWASHLIGWQQSGLTQRAYCEQQGLALKTFSYWRTQALTGKLELPTPITPALTLIPVTSVSTKTSDSTHAPLPTMSLS